MTAGGIPLQEVKETTLESRKTKGLFLAGELLDVDGPCGGYNLQWAWASGYALAGLCRERRFMIQVQQLKLPVGHKENALLEALISKLHVKKDEILSFEVAKRSLDARKKPELFYSYVVNVQVKNQAAVLKRKPKNTIPFEKKLYQLPSPLKESPSRRPVIIGSGPAGLFASLVLARLGCRPILLERGDSVETRQKKVDLFWNTGVLDPESNVQFGEGGAGTFSDGKLNTAVKDPSGRNGFVLRTFVEMGADPEILYLNKPHIGTDILRTVVTRLREEILSLGGEVRFRSQVTDFFIKDGRMTGVEINGIERLDADQVILATGHSARDTFRVLLGKPVLMKAKSFAVGVRMEHPQKLIDSNQYGRAHEAFFLLQIIKSHGSWRTEKECILSACAPAAMW